MCQKEKQGEKRRGKLISQNSFTHLFNIQMTKYIYYPTVFIRVIVYFLLCHGSLNYCPVNIWTIDWHYTMAWLPASLLKTHRRLSTCATTMPVWFVYERRHCATKVKMSQALATLNSNNFVVYGQKHKVWVLVFLVRTSETF